MWEAPPIRGIGRLVLSDDDENVASVCAFPSAQVDVIERTSNRDDGVHDGHYASKST